MSSKQQNAKTRSRSSPNKATTSKVEELASSNDLTQDLLLEFTGDTLASKVEFKNDKTLSQLIDMVKNGVLGRLNKHDYLKEEIYKLSLNKPCGEKSASVKLITDKICAEWKLVKEKAQIKLNKLEGFKTKLNEIDVKLNTVREQIFAWETYLDHECFSNLDLTTYQQILGKKNELEDLLDNLNKKDVETQHLFKMCISANSKNLNGNKKNQILILNIRERWSNLKSIVREKICLLENVWLMLCDINDQIENFYAVLNKTEQFYRNSLLTTHSNNAIMSLKLVAQLYSTIKEDYKLIKYLNESYVNFSKLISNFELFKRLETLRKPILELNARWDSLHNEIAIKIKTVINLCIFKKQSGY